MHRTQSATISKQFYSSIKSPLAKYRNSLWWWLVASWVFLIVISKKHEYGRLWLPIVFTYVVVAIFDSILKRRLPDHQPIVTLDNDGIESQLFAGAIKRHSWSELVEANISKLNNLPFIQFRLQAIVGVIDDSMSWTGINPARPVLPISSLSTEDQIELLEIINQRLGFAQSTSKSTGNSSASQSANNFATNPLAEEKAFHDQLEAYAPIAWITWLLIGVNVLVWIAMWHTGAKIEQTPPEQLLSWGGNTAFDVQRGEWWRMATAMFLHGSLIHLGINMAGLYVVGGVVERIYGHLPFTLIYLGSGLIGNGLSLYFGAQYAVSAGASGAVLGVTIALMVGMYQHRERLPKIFSKRRLSGIVLFVFYALLYGFINRGIDNAAHIGGMLTGCLLGLLLPERLDMESFKHRVKKHLIIGLSSTVIATTALVSMSPQATLNIKSELKNQALLVQGANSIFHELVLLDLDIVTFRRGQMSAAELNSKIKNTYLSGLKQAIQQLSEVRLAESDQRLQMLQEMKLSTALLVSIFELAPFQKPGSGKTQPTDLERATLIKDKLKAITARILHEGHKVRRL